VITTGTDTDQGELLAAFVLLQNLMSKPWPLFPPEFRTKKYLPVDYGKAQLLFYYLCEAFWATLADLSGSA
jgi:hypothetical protein